MQDGEGTVNDGVDHGKYFVQKHRLKKNINARERSSGNGRRTRLSLRRISLSIVRDLIDSFRATLLKPPPGNHDGSFVPESKLSLRASSQENEAYSKA